MKKISDKKVLDLLKRVNTGEEEATNQLLEALVCVLLDIRTSVKKDSCKVFNQPWIKLVKFNFKRTTH